MTLEAAKEMDRRCVLDWLYELFVTPSRAFDEYTEDELKMFAHDAIVLLEEQKPVQSGVDADGVPHCGSCGWIQSYGCKYCDNCGKRLFWE